MEFLVDPDNHEFMDALNLVKHTNRSVFLTGKAGTGKSTFLRYVNQQKYKRTVVLAPTGVAAINAGGSTLHSFFKLPFRPMLPDDVDLNTKNGRIFEFFKYNKQHRKLIESVELIIIDEISMVRADTIDTIDRILRVYSGNMREPFGGKQMLFVGDVFQLEPVVKSDEREILNQFYPSPYFFSAHVFNDFTLVPIELTKSYRQKDISFVNVLDKIRNNSVDSADLALLNEQYNPTYQPAKGELCITLATRVAQVDSINQARLGELKTPNVVFNGVITGEFPDNSLPTLKMLSLKIGAQVIFIHNDFGPIEERKWANGTLGKVIDIVNNESVWVELENGKSHKVELILWRNVRYKYNEKEHKIEEQEIGTFTQLPIRLAWAITVHKSQGLTFTNAIIDFTGGVFAGGQTYVALSRCTHIEGIKLRKELTRSDVFVRQEVVQFSHTFNNRQIIDKAMKEAEADVLYAQAVKYFDEGDFSSFMPIFFKAIHSRYDIEKPLQQRFIRRKLNIINSLRSEIDRLKIEKKRESDFHYELAHEFYLMANECYLKMRNHPAALANLEKALQLYPKHVEALIRKGTIYVEQKLFVEADQAFNKACKLSPKNYDAFLQRGLSRIAQKHYEAAISDLTKALSFQKRSYIAAEALAEAYYKTNEEDLADSYFSLADNLREQEKRRKKGGK